MEIERLIADLNRQQKELEAVHKQLMQTTITKEEESQTFLFDLKDYADSLSLVTVYAEPVQVEAPPVQRLSAILGEQVQTLQQLIRILSAQEESEAADFYGQQGGELRRTIASLNGIVELNGLLLQYNLTFQRKLKDHPLQQLSVQETADKPGFFQRLFGK
ncbi:hypothetical protein [Enterococcus sp.]|uniref:hypothetical protein n=1 Tax=Enterococcus sp. TaxID=35783 RepID=UPI0028A26295|nr:hypothetical protein [Enterococcus sp.]